MVEANIAEGSSVAQERANKNNKVRYCFVIRHGERGDKSPDDEILAANAGIPDPILTQTGHKQAQETGVFMRQEIAKIEESEGRKFDKIAIRVSPFQRTVSTCAEVANELGIKDVKIDYAYVEFMKQELYPDGDPLPNLEVRKLGSIDEFNTKFGKEGAVNFIDDFE